MARHDTMEVREIGRRVIVTDGAGCELAMRDGLDGYSLVIEKPTLYGLGRVSCEPEIKPGQIKSMVDELWEVKFLKDGEK